jgi:hypothetical protein
MLIQPTLDTLNRLKLHGMALALSEQMTHNTAGPVVWGITNRSLRGMHLLETRSSANGS